MWRNVLLDDNMNKHADWLSWSLHFILGLAVGGIGSLYFVQGGRRCIPLITVEAVPWFMFGGALIGASLASRFGDRLWLGSSYRVIPPDEPRQNTASRWTSHIVGCIGAVFAVLALARSFGLLP